MLKVQHFYDAQTSTLTYVVHHSESKDGVVIDPVWNFDPASGRLSTESVEELSHYLTKEKINLHYILETHAHADHLSGAQILKKNFPKAKILIGDQIPVVQEKFKKLYNYPDSFPSDGRQFDGLLKDQSLVRVGEFEFKVLNTPGHTPACVSYLFRGMIFTGDCLFMPDSGTGRCDFPGGSAEQIYDSITKKIYSLPDDTKTFTGHDYQPGGRELQFQSTVKEHKKSNTQINETIEREDFVLFRQKRDATLPAPKLLLPSLQVNIRAGHLPEAESNGVSYLKLPLTVT